MQRKTILNLSLGAVCVIATLNLARIALEPPTVANAPLGNNAGDAKSTLPAGFTAPARESFAEIDQRPLLNPNRRPAARLDVAATAAAAKLKTATPPPAPPTFSPVLLGIIGEPGQRIAVLKTPSLPTAIDVKVGGMIDGWQVLDIQADWISVRANTTDQTIKLEAHSGNQARGQGAAKSANQGSGPGGGMTPRPLQAAGQQSQKTR